MPRHHACVPVLLLLAALLAGCATADQSEPLTDGTTSPDPAEASPVAASPSPDAGASPSPSPSSRPSPLPELKSEYERVLEEGYTVSDDWVVETVVADLDMGTGGLVVLEDGSFLQADFGYTGHPGDRIYRISPEGDVETLVQSDDFSQLTMTNVGHDGAIYQTGFGSDAVYRIGLDGSVETLATEVYGAAGVVAEEDGTVYAASYKNGLIVRIDPDGTVTEIVRDKLLNGVNSLTLGPDGTIYAANHRNGRINEITPEGEISLLHEFPKSTSHLVHHDGSLFITSRGLYVILRLDLETEEVELIAGDGESGDADGRGAAASFGQPNAITVGPDGALYFNHGSASVPTPLSIRRLVHRPEA